MKELTDEEMQELIEQGLLSSKLPAAAQEQDLANYKTVYEALGKEPPIPLRYNFAARITDKIQAEKNRATEFKVYCLLAVAMAALMIGAFIYLHSFESIPGSVFVQQFSKYKWVIAFSVICFVVVQLLDKKLITRAKT